VEEGAPEDEEPLPDEETSGLRELPQDKPGSLPPPVPTEPAADETSTTLRLPRIDVAPEAPKPVTQVRAGGFVAALSQAPATAAAAGGSESPDYEKTKPRWVPPDKSTEVPASPLTSLDEPEAPEAPPPVTASEPPVGPIQPRKPERAASRVEEPSSLAAALDAAAPPPAGDEQEVVVDESKLEYFDGHKYAKEFGEATTQRVNGAEAERESAPPERESEPERETVPAARDSAPYEEEEAEERPSVERVTYTPPPGPGKAKPIAITIAVLAIVGIAAFLYIRSRGPSVKDFDSAPILQEGAPPDPGETAPYEGSSLVSGGEGDAPLAGGEEPAAGGEEPAVAAGEEPAAGGEEPAAGGEEPAVAAGEEPAVGGEEPAVAAGDEPAVVGAADLATYEDLLEQASKKGGKKKAALLREAIAVNPQGDKALADLSLMLMEGRKTRDEALELAQRAVRANHDNGQAWLVIGYIYQITGKRMESREAYKKCSECSGPRRFIVECRRLIR
jgi:hypothetical protein